MWHHAQFRGEELIVLGHNPTRNDCMLVKLSGLPMNEQSELRRIAASRPAQQASSLIPVLQRMDSPRPHMDWWTYLARKMEQRNSPVFTLPIKEIQDSLDGDQKAIFKGYGKNRQNSKLDADEYARNFGGDAYDDEAAQNDEAVEHEVPIGSSLVNTSGHKPAGDIGYKMDLLMETMVDENRRTQQLLTKLIGALSGEPEVEPVKHVAPKARKPRTAAKKTNGKEVHA